MVTAAASALRAADWAVARERAVATADRMVAEGRLARSAVHHAGNIARNGDSCSQTAQPRKPREPTC